MIAVILAGGKGLRLWPESRKHRPKQLCTLVDDKTMLDHTIDRLSACGADHIIIITSSDLVDSIENVVSNRPDQLEIEILSEPELKNTAPAIGLALAKCLQENRKEILGIFPADHHISDDLLFKQSLEKAILAAENGRLVTIGIKPDRPETGYGYIEKTMWEIGSIPDVFEVQAFREKPTVELAETYFQDGIHLWNAGIYVGHISTFMEEFNDHLPELFVHMIKGYDHYYDSYADLPNISIDYGIAEKSNRIAVVPSSFPWCDLGSWNSYIDLYPIDEFGNVQLGTKIFSLDSKNCVVKQKDKNIVLFGLDDLLIVEEDDLILITPRKRSQDIRDLVASLELNRKDLL